MYVEGCRCNEWLNAKTEGSKTSRDLHDSPKFYYESITREVKSRLTYEYRYDERLKTKTEESTHLTDTGLLVELEHLKIKTRLIDKKFASVRSECISE